VELLDAQLSYWLCIRSLMQNGGYDSVRRHMPHVSEELANTVSYVTIPSLRSLCTAEVSILRPSISDAAIKNTLLNDGGDALGRAKMALQAINENAFLEDE